MRIDDLKLFTTVVQLGSFTAAANAMDLPRANVSRRIGELEKSLNAQLFFRTTRKLRLSQHGEAYYKEVLTVLEAYQKANDTLLKLDDRPVGKVKLGLLPESDEAIQHILYQFQDMYPEIDLDIRSTNSCYTDMYEQGLDLAIHAGKLHDSSFVARHIAQLGRMLLASPSYIEQYGMPNTLAELATHQCICYRWPDGTLEDNWDLIDEEVKVKSRLASNNIGFIRRAMLDGRGIGILPPLLALASMESGALVRVLPQYQSRADDVWLLYPDRHGISRATRLLIDLLLQELPKKL
ncbi:LysR family transcriptional regulator [Photobacterium frigidiphilum]|uniref:LysR family transcriptional regulator n=1 Tax=Photobacterium frigidiphilum TaxID=264736 RepID=UPI003D0CDB0B